ncbi:MAG: hypothetical protein WDN26_01490 [Chitinophagaceae bacterium]
MQYFPINGISIKKETSQLLSKEQKDEWSVATDDDSSNTAG